MVQGRQRFEHDGQECSTVGLKVVRTTVNKPATVLRISFPSPNFPFLISFVLLLCILRNAIAYEIYTKIGEDLETTKYGRVL